MAFEEKVDAAAATLTDDEYALADDEYAIALSMFSLRQQRKNEEHTQIDPIGIPEQR